MPVMCFSYVRCGLESLKHILRTFTPIIKANISAPPSASVGVDISREERSVCWSLSFLTLVICHSCLNCCKCAVLLKLSSNSSDELCDQQMQQNTIFPQPFDQF